MRCIIIGTEVVSETVVKSYEAEVQTRAAVHAEHWNGEPLTEWQKDILCVPYTRKVVRP